MGNQKKGHKRAERVKGKSSSTSGLAYVLWASLAAFAAMIFVLFKQNAKLDVLRESGSDHYASESYATSVPDDIIQADHLSPELREAIGVYTEPETHPDKRIRSLPNDLKNWPPGERGVGVLLDESKMSDEEVQKRKDMWQAHAFEEYISELISYNRSLPDWRGDWCRSTYNPERTDLDPTSVVICFHNEAWSTLVRTVHSIVNRSPDRLIEEILLIDDSSNMEHLGQRLDDYMERFDKVRIVRGEERMGLIRCRMHGAQIAKGKSLTFLDSHIEAGIGWLEPLLYRVKDEPKLIVSPVIDAINDTTFWYTFIQKDLKGLLNWKMVFEWHEVPPEDRVKKPNVWAPHPNPVMSGGLFTINNEWFKELGYYDTGMEIWGGENLEVSFKAWMCGGRIEVAPCSRVGHVFRTFSPYKVDTAKNVNYNNIRVADVWMDEFKYLFYDRLGKFDLPMKERLGYYGEIAERKAIREKMNCKSFKWYLDNVAKGLPYHQLIGAGEIRNPSYNFCLDQNDRTEFINSPVYVTGCHGEAGNQYWWLNKNYFLMRDYTCIGVQGDRESVAIMDCAHARPWKYNQKLGRLEQGGKCLAVGSKHNIYTALMEKCEEGKPSQEWIFTRFDYRGLNYEDLVDVKKNLNLIR